MNLLRAAAAMAGLLVCLAGQVWAADTDALMGRWIDKLPGGNAMVIEFAPERISFQGMLIDGTMAPPSAFGATYRQAADGKYTVEIEGQPNDPLTVTVTQSDKLTLQFPGRDPRDLIRFVPTEATAKPPGHP